MYYYLYDSFLSDPKYEKILDKIKTRLLDLEIQGKPGHLSLLKNANELIKDEIKNGVKTVVVVGNDRTFLKVINVIANYDLTLGIIPIGENNLIAAYLGVPPEELSCDILAARKVEKIDLGLANDVYFFSNIKIDKDLNRISLKKDNFQIVPQPNCRAINIFNLCYDTQSVADNEILKRINPQDGQMDIVIEESNKSARLLNSRKNNIKCGTTLLNANDLEIKSFEYLPVKLDNFYILKTPVKVSTEKEKLKLIVGRNRKF